jgi:AraC-like DNA-binding protein
MFLKYITVISGFNYLIFSAVLLLKKTTVRKDNLVLGFIFFLMASYSLLISVYNTALVEKDYTLLSYYLPVNYVLIALMGPLMYFYVKTVLNISFSPRSLIVCLHVLPIIPPLLFIIYFASLPTVERIDLLIKNYNDGIWFVNLLNGLFYIQMTIYLFICYRLIRNQLKMSSKICKGSLQVDISWLKSLLIIDLFFMIASAPFCFYFCNEKTSNIIAQLAMDIQLVYIFFRTTWQTGVFPTEEIIEQKSKETILKIADELAEDYFKRLMVFMEEKKPFLVENCTIQYISEQTCIPVHHLSNILNQRFDKNFSDFINGYRINKAKVMLDSIISEKMTLEAVGYECGFGSKSSFNKAFKKLTNFTPSEYKLKSKSYKF